MHHISDASAAMMARARLSMAADVQAGAKRRSAMIRISAGRPRFPRLRLWSGWRVSDARPAWIYTSASRGVLARRCCPAQAGCCRRSRHAWVAPVSGRHQLVWAASLASPRRRRGQPSWRFGASHIVVPPTATPGAYFPEIRLSRLDIAGRLGG